MGVALAPGPDTRVKGNPRLELRNYRVKINGLDHTLQLSESEARRIGVEGEEVAAAKAAPKPANKAAKKPANKAAKKPAEKPADTADESAGTGESKAADAATDTGADASDDTDW